MLKVGNISVFIFQIKKSVLVLVLGCGNIEKPMKVYMRIYLYVCHQRILHPKYIKWHCRKQINPLYQPQEWEVSACWRIVVSVTPKQTIFTSVSFSWIFTTIWFQKIKSAVSPVTVLVRGVVLPPRGLGRHIGTNVEDHILDRTCSWGHWKLQLSCPRLS